MKKKYRTDDLKVGMFVDLPYSWFTKIFKESEFLLESQEQIEFIKSKDIRHVMVDLETGLLEYFSNCCVCYFFRFLNRP